MKILASLLLFALAAWASVDGKWTVEPSKSAKKGKAVEVTMNLKAEGEKLTGSVTRASKRERITDIENGKISGNKFSFTLVQKSKKGESRKTQWEGTVEGDTMSGTTTAEGRKHGVAFTAKRAAR